jgi:hypothetical protein
VCLNALTLPQGQTRKGGRGGKEIPAGYRQGYRRCKKRIFEEQIATFGKRNYCK